MTIEELYRFVEAAGSGSIGNAAESLNISTQGLSQSIRRLESELGIRLFERTISGVELTPAGKEIYEYANQILTITRKIMDCAESSGAENKLKLRCAIVNSIVADDAKTEVEAIAEAENIDFEYINCGEKKQLDKLFQQKGCEVILTFMHESNEGFTDWASVKVFSVPIGIVVNRNSDLFINGLDDLQKLSEYTIATDAEEKNIRTTISRLYGDEGIALKRKNLHGFRRCLENIESDPSIVTFTYKSKFNSSNKFGEKLKFIEIKSIPPLLYAAYIRKNLPEYKRVRKFYEKVCINMSEHITDI